MPLNIPAHVLVVEDTPLYREAFCNLIEECFPGVHVTCVEDGSAALSITRKTRFDLIILDYQLPSITGSDVLRHLRQRSRTTNIALPPIVMMSTQPDVAVFARASGATGFLNKPALADDIVAILSPYLGQHTDLPTAAPVTELAIA